MKTRRMWRLTAAALAVVVCLSLVFLGACAPTQRTASGHGGLHRGVAGPHGTQGKAGQHGTRFMWDQPETIPGY